MEERNEVYLLTQISGVAVYEKRSSSNSGSFHNENESYALRIPEKATVQEGRTYIPCGDYDELSDTDAIKHWTIHGDDLIIICAAKIDEIDIPIVAADGYTLNYAQSEAAGATYGYQKTLIHVTGYADNTRRGSAATRHWRIEGA